jgi:hypothetical protein
MICRACGGGKAHHAVDIADDGCWCKACRELDPAKRCRLFDPVAAAARFKKTAKKATVSRPEVSLPRDGTFKRQVYDFIATAGVAGLTRAELEYKTAKAAEVVANALIGLRSENLIEPSGRSPRSGPGGSRPRTRRNR